MKDQKSQTEKVSSTNRAVGTGAGAVAGGAAGAAIGTVVPGVGNVVGAVVGGIAGAVAGAAAGNAIAKKINPQVEDDYWRQNYASRPYSADTSYQDLGPAYRYGWETRGRYDIDKSFDAVEGELGTGWEAARGSSRLSWDRARDASQDAWDRIGSELDEDDTFEGERTDAFDRNKT